MHQSQGAKVGQCAELSGEGCDSPLSRAPIVFSLEHTDTKSTDRVVAILSFLLLLFFF